MISAHCTIEGFAGVWEEKNYRRIELTMTYGNKYVKLVPALGSQYYNLLSH